MQASSSVEEAAEFLCRTNRVDDVARKCAELVIEAETARDPPARFLRC
jgi:hypothetical protein